jgi:RTX calcium-binding nonapeptide repeat (4 copies)
MVGPTPPSAYYPVAPTPTSNRVDLLQNWLDSQLSDADDTVFITKEGDDKYKIDVNGEVEYVTAEELKKLKFELKGGKDTMVVGEDVPVDITVDMGDGDDRFWGGGGNDKADGGKGNDKIYGRGGNDVMNGGDGNDEIWGLLGKNTMIGGAGKDTFMTGSGPQSLMDFDGSQDSHPTTTAPPSTTTTAAPMSAAPATTAPTTAAPTTTAPTTTPTATPTTTSTSSAGGIVINGDNNTIYTGSATAGTATTGNNITLASVMAGPIWADYKETSPGVYTRVKSDETITMTQPGGAGTPLVNTTTTTSGPNKGAVLVVNVNPDGTKAVFDSYNNPRFTEAQNKIVNDAMKSKGGQFDADYLAKQLDLVMGGDSKMKKKGAHGNTSASGASGSATGTADADAAVDGSGDGYSGLNVDGANEATSWFLVLAEGMGKIMNKFAEKMIDLLNQIEAAGDDPPYELTAKFQATSQQLAFMQQAFMTALNSLGESIKTGVTAGGAAR